MPAGCRTARCWAADTQLSSLDTGTLAIITDRHDSDEAFRWLAGASLDALQEQAVKARTLWRVCTRERQGLLARQWAASLEAAELASWLAWLYETPTR